MRKALIFLLIIIVTMSILWVFAGRQLSSFVDQFKMNQIEALSVRSISYEGTGDGGTLVFDDHRLSLSPINPHVGSTKENALALANSGKVFPFGPLHSAEPLTADAETDDNASLARQRSYLVWPSVNGGQLSWNRAEYDKLTWNKQNGAKLEMLWSIDREKNATSLIRIDISNAAR